MINNILDSSNAFFSITNYGGSSTISTFGGLPLGTVGASATGELGVKVIPVGTFTVVVGSITAGSAIIGKVSVDQTTPGTTDRVTAGGSTVTPTSTPTLSVAGAYSDGDYIGTSAAPASFASVVRTSGGTGVIQSLVITDKVVTAAVAMELWLFNATITVPTDNAAWTITDADALKCIGVIPLAAADWYLGTVNKVYSKANLGLPIKPAATSLFYALVARAATPTWATGDLQLTFGVLQD